MGIFHAGPVDILSLQAFALAGAGMQFHNTRGPVYPAWMPRSSARSAFGRLRASTRLAVFMLLVFALKLGTAAACAKHDLAVLDPGGSGHVAMVASEQEPSNPGQLPAHAGSCTHCECHHSATIPSQPVIALVTQAPTLASTWTAPIPFAEVRQDLRPPIA